MASQFRYNDAGSSGLGILSSKLGSRDSPSKRGILSSKLGSRDLPSKHLLGTGLASVGYETELNGKKCARKDFMGVSSSTFRREVARLVGLEDHINVVKTLGWTENNMSCSLVLEYMDDDLLGFLQKRKQSQGSMEASPKFGNQSNLDSRNMIKMAPFELPEALDLMLQIARGMEYLADKGIRHGNLKTKNILVTCTNNQGRNSLLVKVADFGLVRTRRKSTSFASRQARKLDMARWTAPEILQVFLLEDKGETSSESDSDEDCIDSLGFADLDVPEWKELGVDVYSFAVICSQILTGEDPYPNLNWKELGIKIMRHGLTPTLPDACPPELQTLLVSCWGFDHSCLRLCEQPSFSYIRRTLERLQQMEVLSQYLHVSLPLPEKEVVDVVQEIDLREPITVEDLWGREWMQDQQFSEWERIRNPIPVSHVAFLITKTRTVVKCRAEWTQLREELERMFPDMLRIRNRWISCEKLLDHVGEGWNSSMKENVYSWSTQLISTVRHTFHEVEKYQQQEDHQSLLSLLSTVLTTFIEPWRVPKLCNDFNELAKQQTKIMLDLTKLLRRAQVLAKDLVRAQVLAKRQVLGQVQEVELMKELRLQTEIRNSILYKESFAKKGKILE